MYEVSSRLSHVFSAQETQIKYTAAQEVNWQATGKARYTCPCVSLTEQVCTTGITRASSICLGHSLTTVLVLSAKAERKDI